MGLNNPVDLIKFGSQFGNVLAYDPSKPAPAGFEKVDVFSKSYDSGLQVTTYFNEPAGQIVVAIAGTNQLADVGGWPAILNGYDGAKAQVDDALQELR